MQVAHGWEAWPWDLPLSLGFTEELLRSLDGNQRTAGLLWLGKVPPKLILAL